MTNNPFLCPIEPELCVGQVVHSADEILFIINRLAEKTAQSPENPLETTARNQRKAAMAEAIHSLALKTRDPSVNGELTQAVEETITHLHQHLSDAEKSPKQEMGNYGVAALIIDKRTKTIVAAGKNSVGRPVYHGGELNPKGDDGHAEVNVLRAFYKKKAKALDAAKTNAGVLPDDDEETRSRKIETALRKVEKEFDPSNYQLWVNLRPCHMCAGAIRACKMDTVYVADDPVIAQYEDQYADAPGPGKEIKKLIRNVDDGWRERIFPAHPQNALSKELRDEANTVFDTTALQVRNRKTQIGQNKHPITDLMTALDTGSEEEKAMARSIIGAIHSVSNEANEYGRNIFSAMAQHNHYEPGLVKDPKTGKQTSDAVSDELIQYLKDSAAFAAKQGNDRNAAIAIDPFGVPWFCTYDRSSARNPLRTPIMRVLRRIEKARTEAGEEIASHMPLQSEFTIVCLKEPNDMEAGRLASSSVKNVLYLEPDLEQGVMSTKQVEKMLDLYKNQRGLGGAIRRAQYPEIDKDHYREGQWRQRHVHRTVDGGYKAARTDR